MRTLEEAVTWSRERLGEDSDAYRYHLGRLHEAQREAEKKTQKGHHGAMANEELEGFDELEVDDLPYAVTLEDFYAHMPSHQYIFGPTRELWPGSSVNARIAPLMIGQTTKGKQKTQAPAAWLDANRAVEQMTWAPGELMLIENRLIDQGGWIERPGCRVFNLYRAPTIHPGAPDQAGPWREHIQLVYPEQWSAIERWLAHRVQRPAEKLNHALVLGGPQGIGKDSLLEPVKYAVGPWNFQEVTPSATMGRFNSFVKSVVLRINEARDHGDRDRYAFYDHTKSLIAAPPDVLRVDEKNLREYAVPNVCAVVVTTNHKGDGIYLPPDDRRHYVAWSDLTKDDFAADYWRRLWSWYHAGGFGHVAAYLRTLDLTGFDPKAPPAKTRAFWEIVDAGRAPEDADLADALDALGQPDAVTLAEIMTTATNAFSQWLDDRRNSRAIPHRFESAGYVRVRNDSQADGRWKLGGKNVVIYARSDLTIRDRITAAREKIR